MTPPVIPPAMPTPDPEPATPEAILEHLMEKPTETLNIPAHPVRAGRHPLRVGTIVWGAVVVALGILVIVVNQAGLHLDAGQTAMWLLFGAGVAMVAGGAVNLLRRK